ncbi:helix-turn-helix transcriptional regulator [Bacillus sp. SM2101]|uniref:helix-turn-helix domain-containing protein n=1 Tax=Bacillus sp. SM2101 TaxID=2805366 RepID=UPI001BDEF037|nr:helix-turn-helix transcriptional regulator [Bacillus sp. SM2101]
MTRDERLQLLVEIKKKELTLKKIAAEMGVTAPLLSQFLNYKCNMSDENISKFKQIVNDAKEYKWVKVVVE